MKVPSCYHISQLSLFTSNHHSYRRCRHNSYSHSFVLQHPCYGSSPTHPCLTYTHQASPLTLQGSFWDDIFDDNEKDDDINKKKRKSSSSPSSKKNDDKNLGDMFWSYLFDDSENSKDDSSSERARYDKDDRVRRNSRDGSLSSVKGEVKDGVNEERVKEGGRQEQKDRRVSNEDDTRNDDGNNNVRKPDRRRRSSSRRPLTSSSSSTSSSQQRSRSGNSRNRESNSQTTTKGERRREGDGNRNIKKKYDDVDKEKEEVMSKQLTELRNTLSSLEEECQRYANCCSTLDDLVKVRTDERDVLNRRVVLLQDTVKSLNSSLTLNTSVEKEKDEQLEIKGQQKCQELESQCKGLNEELNLLKRKMEEDKVQGKVGQIAEEEERLLQHQKQQQNENEMNKIITSLQNDVKEKTNERDLMKQRTVLLQDVVRRLNSNSSLNTNSLEVKDTSAKKEERFDKEEALLLKTESSSKRCQELEYKCEGLKKELDLLKHDQGEMTKHEQKWEKERINLSLELQQQHQRQSEMDEIILSLEDAVQSLTDERKILKRRSILLQEVVSKLKANPNLTLNTTDEKEGIDKEGLVRSIKNSEKRCQELEGQCHELEEELSFLKQRNIEKNEEIVLTNQSQKKREENMDASITSFKTEITQLTQKTAQVENEKEKLIKKAADLNESLIRMRMKEQAKLKVREKKDNIKKAMWLEKKEEEMELRLRTENDLRMKNILVEKKEVEVKLNDLLSEKKQHEEQQQNQQQQYQEMVIVANEVKKEVEEAEEKAAAIYQKTVKRWGERRENMGNVIKNEVNERQKIEKQLESARLINEKLSIRLKENETRDNLLRKKKEEVEKTVKDSEEVQNLNEVAVIAKAAVEQARVREVSLLKELELTRNEVRLGRSEFETILNKRLSDSEEHTQNLMMRLKAINNDNDKLKIQKDEIEDKYRQLVILRSSSSEISGSSNISIVSGANEGRRKLRREDNMYDDSHASPYNNIKTTDENDLYRNEEFLGNNVTDINTSNRKSSTRQQEKSSKLLKIWKACTFSERRKRFWKRRL